MDPQVKPKHILFLLILVQGMLLCMAILYQKNIFPFGENGLRFQTLDDAFLNQPNKKVDLKKITEKVTTLDSSITQLEKQSDSEELQQLKKETEILICYDSLKVHPLASFYQVLAECEKTGKKVRIAHYGDSEIEGDRITDYLRHRLQLRFGGTGPGFILPIDVSNSRLSVQQSESPNWQKFSAFGNNPRMKDKIYGVSGSAYRPLNQYAYNPERELTDKDSLKKNYKPYNGDSYLIFRPSKSGYPGAKRFSHARLFYSQNESNTFSLRIKTNSKTDSLQMESGLLKEFNSFFEQTPDFVKYSFLGDIKPIVFGVSLEGDSGIILDNFPMRGSSGTEFTKMNGALLEQFLSLLDTKLLILSYGINVVPYADEIADVNYYEKEFTRQLNHLKKLNPGRSILIMSVGDLSMKKGTEMVSYPYIAAIRDAQYRAALNTGCAFWDLFQAMGGENSMKEWVLANPQLAAKDFTHFTPAGAHIVAEMFFKALMKDYLEFLKKKEY